MSNDNKTLELQIRIAADDALRAVSSLKGEITSLAGEARKLSEQDGRAIADTFRQTQDAAERAAASMKLFGESSSELRQVQSQLKSAAVELVAKGLDPQSDEVKKLIEEYKRLEKEAADLDKANGKNVESFGDLQSSIMRLAEVAALMKALSVVKDMDDFALRTADSFQTAKNQFGVLLGDMQAGAGLFNEIKAFNDKTPFDLDTLTQATNVLISAKVPLQDLQAQLTKFGDLSQGSSQKLTSYVNAFSQAAAKGKADMHVLNTYLHQGVQILEPLAKSFGVTEDKIIEMASQGKISFADFSKALDDLTAAGGQYFGGMELASRSLAAMQEGLKEEVNSLAASFGEMLLPSAVSVTGALTELAGWINEHPLAKGFFAGAIVAVTGLLTAMAVKAAALTVKTWLAQAAQMGFNASLAVTSPALWVAIGAAAAATVAYVAYAAQQQNATRSSENFTLAQLKQKNAINSAADAIARYIHAANGMTDEQIRGAINSINEYLNDFTDEEYEAFFDEVIEETRKLNILRDTLSERRGEFIKTMFAGTNAEKIKTLNEQLERAQKYLTDPGLNGEERSQLEVIVEKLTDDLEKLKDAGDGLQGWQETLKSAMNFSDADVDNGFLKTGAAALEEYAKRLQAAEERGLALSGVLGDEASVLQNTAAQWENLLSAMAQSGHWEASELSIQKVAAALEAARDAAAAAEYVKTMKDLAKQIDDAGKSERQLAYEAELARLGLDAQSKAAEALRNRMNELDVKSTLAALREEVQNLGKDQYDLALATLAAAGASEEEIKQAEEMIETLRRHGQSFEEFLSQNIVNSLTNAFSELDKQAAAVIANITTQLATVSFNGLLDGLSAVGKAFASGEKDGDNFTRAMADMARQILNQLPMMFLQAGLQLIAQGQWPLGLAFVAAAGASSLVSGYVDGTIEEQKKEAKAAAEASKHAQGSAFAGAFDEYGQAARAFAAGGTFTNQIVSRPTYFRHGGGLGLMGEAGPEAVMPLRRMANGDLGVQTAGGGARVTVIVNNNSGAAVRQKESEDGMGNKTLEIDIGGRIGELVNRHVASGKADGVMGGRYGLRAAGV